MQTCAGQRISAASKCSSKQLGTHRTNSIISNKVHTSFIISQKNALTNSPAPKSFGTASPTRRLALTVAQAAQAEVGKLISKVEIPAFIPRPDLMDQLLRWATIEVQENGMGNVGCPCKVTPYTREGYMWGFTVSFLKDGVSATDIRVAFDEEVTLKHEWIGRGAGLLPHGFPILEGNSEEVIGKNFEIRKVDEAPMTDALRSSVKEFCQMLVAAINKYYAFGSCFVDDST